MRSAVLLLAVAGLAAVAAGCTESRRARTAATFADQPADITCWAWGAEIFSGRSTGKVEYNDSGRISFVDAANGRFTTLDGECRVVYLNEGDEDTPPPAPAADANSGDQAVEPGRPEKIPTQ